ncbi:MAG: benzoyl-CoA-dihydrodiol lyase [Betaproteobacteria bacterium]|nr:benzoyl-CoA-dihydrodiol lyase [Betaproteobacteria bacterium]
MDLASTSNPIVDYRTYPGQYRHWRMNFEGDVATLAMDVNEDGGLRPGYKLKLNSYDLGVDIELYDALQRIRFEHPEIKVVVLTSAKERMFCSGANIYMLGLSSHAWKVNFCKFTNETRNGIEDASRYSGLKFIAALNGNTAGGGYEVALACDEILMIDDRSSAVSLPEVPLLGVLPGTGGLTRLTDKRKVRRDLADMFCTTSEGVRAERALQWGLVDAIAKPAQFPELVVARAAALARTSERSGGKKGIVLDPLSREFDERGYRYEYVGAEVNRAARSVTLTVSAPEEAGAFTESCRWWPLQMARELDDAILSLRTNELDLGMWVLKTRGNPAAVLAYDEVLRARQHEWFVKETLGMLRSTFARLEVSSRSMFAVVDRDSCFAGTLAELLWAADRTYMMAFPNAPEEEPCVILSPMNFGPYLTVEGEARLASRFYGDLGTIENLRALIGQSLRAKQALDLGLVSVTPDDIDWEDEIRLALEERASISPDALTGLEANLRFTRSENMYTRIFARLSAWQNWIFNRPNAVGEAGALKVFGTGKKAKFNWERV